MRENEGGREKEKRGRRPLNINHKGPVYRVGKKSAVTS